MYLRATRVESSGLHRLAAAAAAIIAAALLCGWAVQAGAQDANITLPVPELERMLTTDPFTIESAEISRPKAKGDITLKADVSFGGKPPVRVKLRKSEPGAETFNNVPRYDLAAYELQKLFLDPAEYVVPPTSLRFVPLDEFRKYSPNVERTFSVADEVLSVMQYWLQDVKVVADVYDAAMFETDAVYARHVGQLNILTDLIDHGDSNVGNFLLGRGTPGARVFGVDNGVAFGSGESDRGRLWAELRVKRLPADAVERLRKITPETLQQSLGVVAQWQLQDGRYVPVPKGGNLSPNHGVRREDNVIQMGLRKSEIAKVWRNLAALLKRVDDGDVKTF
jgi:hypothetical protein